MTAAVNDNPQGFLLAFGQLNEFQASIPDRFSPERFIFRQTENIINRTAIDAWEINLRMEMSNDIKQICLEGFIGNGIVFDHQPAQAEILDGDSIAIAYDRHPRRMRIYIVPPVFSSFCCHNLTSGKS